MRQRAQRPPPCAILWRRSARRWEVSCASYRLCSATCILAAVERCDSQCAGLREGGRFSTSGFGVLCRLGLGNSPRCSAHRADRSPLAEQQARLAARCPCLTLVPRPVSSCAVAGGLRGNLLQAARSVVAAHGMGALYKGFRASLIGDVLGNALGFTAYEIGNR